MDNVLNFIDFLKTSTNPYEAVRSLKNMLVSNSYTELHEYSKFDIKKGGKYFVTRNNSSIIAFRFLLIYLIYHLIFQLVIQIHLLLRLNLLTILLFKMNIIC